MRRPSLMLALVMLLFSSAAFAPLVPPRVLAQDTVYQEDFEDGQAQGWSLEPGWQVQLDDGNHILAGQGHVWARGGQSFEGDLHQAFRVKLLKGGVHLVVRLTDASRYYIGFDANGTRLSKQYFPDDFQNGLAGSSNPHSFDRWYQVVIVLQGSTITLLVDGTQQWSYTDSQPLTSGSLAFESLDNSQVFVDDIVVDAGTGAVPAAPATSALSPTAASTASAANLTWVRTGGPLGGLGYDIRMRPDDPDLMFVTDAFAGAFASNNGAQIWFPSNDGITTRVGTSGDAIPVFSLTIDPNNQDIVWAGTQYQRGVFKSLDGGNTWTKMDNGILESEGITFRGFTVQPGDSNTVYAAAELSSWAWRPDHQQRSGTYFDLTRGVVYKTTNGGQSWTSAWRGDNLARYIWINPQDTNILYVSTGIFDREAANSDPAAGTPGGEGVIKSTDGGISWANVNNGLENLYVGSLFMHPTNPEILLAGAGNNAYYPGSGVYLSLDGGGSWLQTLEANHAITAVEISEADPNIAYAGSRAAVYRSQDGGRNWQETTGDFWGVPGVQTGFPIDFHVDPRDPDRIFTNAYGGGAFLSDDGGRNWQDASRGYTGAQVRDLVVDPTAPGHIIAVARSGVFASHDGGATWNGTNPSTFDSIEWNLIGIDPSNPQHLIGGLNVQGRLVGSTDGGSNWTMVFGPYEDQMGWRAIAFAPSDPRVVYAGTSAYQTASTFVASRPGLGTFVSRDNAGSWRPASNGPMQEANVSYLAVSPSDPQFVLAATTNRGLLQSADGGANWTQVGGGLPGSTPMLSVAFQPNDSNVVFVGLHRGGLYRSTDAGKTWNRAAGGLVPEASVSDIIFDPTNPAMVLYLSDLDSGVYRSVDGGNSWAAINQGLLMRAVNALAISNDGLHLYAGTEGNGVYRLDLNGLPPAAAAAPQPAATAYQYQTPTAMPAAPSDATAQNPLRVCASALTLPLLAVGLVWRRTSGARSRRVRE